MPDDTGTQYAGLTSAERALARADDHMSTCDEPQMADCEICTRRIGKYRKYLGVLADAGLLRETLTGDPRDTPERRQERALWLREIAQMLREQSASQHHSEFVVAADWLDPPMQRLERELLTDAEPVAPPHTGPRTWQMPEIPPDLTRVRDNLGREWRFETEGRWAGSWVTSADEKPGWIAKAREENVRSLFLRWGPLTEVLPNGD